MNEEDARVMPGPSAEVRPSGEGPEAFLGDVPGDVTRIELPSPVGQPLALPDGRIMLWGTSGEERRQAAVARYSDDDGLTWGEPRRLFDFPRDRGSFGGGASLLSSSGAIHLFGLDYYDFDFHDRDRSKSLLWHARSRDGGHSWEPLQWVDFGLSYTGASNSAFQLSSGRIIVPVSGLSDRRIGAWVSLAPYSDDDGASWHAPVEQIGMNTGASDWYESGAAEPVGIELADGRVWLLPRSQDGYHWETLSEDGGVHWSEPRHTRFVCNQSAMAVLRLRDGRLMLLWNNCGAEGLGDVSWGNAERAVMAAALSRDEGKTWIGYREVGRVVENAQVSYPYVTLTSDDHVLLSAAGHLLRIDPEFLERPRLEEDFSTGVRRWSTLAATGVSAVADPSGGGGSVLHMARPAAGIPCGASLNFPFGRSGDLTMVMRVDEGFGGAHATLSDHYDLPGVERDGSFPVRVAASGRMEIIGSGGSWLDTPGDMVSGAWHELRMCWDCALGRARLWLDGTQIAVIEQYVRTEGVCYLRLRSTAGEADTGGMYLRSVRIETS